MTPWPTRRWLASERRPEQRGSQLIALVLRCSRHLVPYVSARVRAGLLNIGLVSPLIQAGRARRCGRWPGEPQGWRAASRSRSSLSWIRCGIAAKTPLAILGAVTRRYIDSISGVAGQGVVGQAHSSADAQTPGVGARIISVRLFSLQGSTRSPIAANKIPVCPRESSMTSFPRQGDEDDDTNGVSLGG